MPRRSSTSIAQIADHRAARARTGAGRARRRRGSCWSRRLTALVIGAVLGLAARIGPLLAGLAVGVPLAPAAISLVRYGWRGVKGLGGDEAEREALDRGESQP